MAREVDINIRVNVLKKGLKNLTSMDKRLKKIASGITEITRKPTSVKQVEKSFKALGYTFNKSGRIVSAFTGRFVKKADVIKNSAKWIHKEMEGTRREFKAWALSLMFFGMAINRTFMGIAKTGINAFMEISEGTGTAGKAINELGAWFTYLKFRVGQAIGLALAPLIPHIIKVVRWFTNLTEKHPKLVAAIIILLTFIGGLMMVFGMLTLGIHGLITFYGILGKAVSGVTAAHAFLLIKIIILVAIVILLYLAWKNNWFNIRGITQKVVNKIIDFLNWVIRGIGRFLGGITSLRMYWEKALIGMKIIFIQIWNGIISAFEEYINDLLGPINEILRRIKKEPIRLNLSGFKKDTKELENQMKNVDAAIENNKLKWEVWAQRWQIAHRDFSDGIGLMDKLKEAFGGLGEIKEKLGGLFGLGMQKGGGLMDKLKEAFGGLGEINIGEKLGGLFGLGMQKGGSTTNIGAINTEVKTGDVSSDVDTDRMADVVSKKIMDDIKTYTNVSTPTG